MTNRAMRTSEHCDPEKFDPNWHLTPDGRLKPDVKQSVAKYFGFGRRYVSAHWHDLGNAQKVLPWTSFCGEFVVGRCSCDAFCLPNRESQGLHRQRYRYKAALPSWNCSVWPALLEQMK